MTAIATPDLTEYRPGLIILFGSGESSPTGRKVFDQICRELPPSPRIALLETPAGFELNSTQVVGRVADFIQQRLQNYHPQVSVIPARKRGTDYSPDDPEIVYPLLEANMIFLGPGSPTYTVRQLRYSLAWDYLVARHRLGAALVMASAAMIAASAFALPVYEIYKVGEDPHWNQGLDFFGIYGLPLVFIPHWNNNDGGAELDTSRCFMGQSRFALLMEMLPPYLTVVGIDEKTALIVDPHEGICRVAGLGGVTLIHTGRIHPGASAEADQVGSGLEEIADNREAHVHQFQNGDSFHLTRIGPFQTPEGGRGLPAEVWHRALEVESKRSLEVGENLVEEPDEEVLAFVKEREAARQRKDWAEADRLRVQIAAMGWEVRDKSGGPLVTKRSQ